MITRSVKFVVVLNRICKIATTKSSNDSELVCRRRAKIFPYKLRQKKKTREISHNVPLPALFCLLRKHHNSYNKTCLYWPVDLYSIWSCISRSFHTLYERHAK